MINQDVLLTLIVYNFVESKGFPLRKYFIPVCLWDTAGVWDLKFRLVSATSPLEKLDKKIPNTAVENCEWYVRVP